MVLWPLETRSTPPIRGASKTRFAFAACSGTYHALTESLCLKWDLLGLMTPSNFVFFLTFPIVHFWTIDAQLNAKTGPCAWGVLCTITDPSKIAYSIPCHIHGFRIIWIRSLQSAFSHLTYLISYPSDVPSIFDFMPASPGLVSLPLPIPSSMYLNPPPCLTHA